MRVETTGGRLRLIREHVMGLSQNELARRCGVSGATVSRWESDDTELGSNEIRKVAAALGVTPAVFFREDEWLEVAKALAVVYRIIEEGRQRGASVPPPEPPSDERPNVILNHQKVAVLAR